MTYTVDVAADRMPKYAELRDTALEPVPRDLLRFLAVYLPASREALLAAQAALADGGIEDTPFVMEALRKIELALKAEVLL